MTETTGFATVRLLAAMQLATGMRIDGLDQPCGEWTEVSMSDPPPIAWDGVCRATRGELG
jgi:hypothetical protein